MTTGGARPKKKRRLVVVLILFGILLSAFFGVRAFRNVIRIAASGLEKGTADADAIRGWMTVPYLARVFELSSDELYAELGVPRAGSDAKSLQTLNKEYFSGQRGAAVAKAKESVRKLLERKRKAGKEGP